jgi:pectate lyase
MRLVANALNPILQENGAQPLGFGQPKARAYSRPEALDMVQDELSGFVGFAEDSSTTGGYGYPVYWVTRSSDDPNTPGTLRYAIAQASAGGGGRIIFDPRDEIDLILASRINVPANCTIAAPGRNVRIRAWSDTALFNVPTTNIIIRYLELSHLIDPTGINNKLVFGDPGYDADQGGPANQADAITVIPTTADKIWIDECTFQHLSDGAIDVSSSALTNASGGPCHFTVSRSIVRGQYKSMLCGSSSTAAGDVPYTNSRKVFGTYFENWYDHCAERHPRVGALGYADSVNNVFDIAQLQTDDGVATGAYGIASLYGGWVQTRGDLFRSLDGVATLAVQTSDGTSIPESATINSGSATEGGLTIQTRNTGTPTALPYSLTAQTVPDVGPARKDWADTIRRNAGARAEAMPRGEFIYDEDGTKTVNGITIRSAPGGGQFQIDSRQDNTVPIPEALSGASAAALWTRGSTKTLSSDTLTIDGTATVWAVNPESGTTDNISTINGGVDNQLCLIRPASSSYTLSFITGGNITLGSSGTFSLTGSKDCALLRYDAGIGAWVVISQPGKKSAAQSDSTATTVAGIVADFNSLLAKMRTAGQLA